VNTLEDFKGLKIRMPGLGGEVMKRLGASVVNLPGGEVTAALASVAIDWVEWSNPYGEASLGFHRHAKYYYTPGWHESGTVLELFTNKMQWDGLEPDLKAIVEQCALGQCCHAERVPGALRSSAPAICQAIRGAGQKAHRRAA
jgi:TRAP-type mannitol/chloroaromatic compound transport system substrate-binding protein